MGRILQIRLLGGRSGNELPDLGKVVVSFARNASNSEYLQRLASFPGKMQRWLPTFSLLS